MDPTKLGPMTGLRYRSVRKIRAILLTVRWMDGWIARSFELWFRPSIFNYCVNTETSSRNW